MDKMIAAPVIHQKPRFGIYVIIICNFRDISNYLKQLFAAVPQFHRITLKPNLTGKRK